MNYKGKILISTPTSSVDIFSRSVILIIEHDKEGTLGLILNKKNKNISHKISELLEFPLEIYNGGPVSHRIFFVIKGKEQDFPNYYKINDDFFLTEDSDSIIRDILENKINLNEIKIFSGYSGWEAHQLENEITNGYWIVSDYQLDLTENYDYNLWKKITENLGGEYPIWANMPEDISMN